MYEVIIPFKDLVNGGSYKKGDEYPRHGVNPTESRINQLAGNGNKFGCPLIRLVSEEPQKRGRPRRESSDD